MLGAYSEVNKGLVLIDGAQRAGTGLIQRLLDGHSGLDVTPFEDRTILGMWEGKQVFQGALENRSHEQLLDALSRWGGLSTLQKHSDDGYIEFSRNRDAYHSTSTFNFDFPLFLRRYRASITNEADGLIKADLSIYGMYIRYLESWFGTLERPGERIHTGDPEYFVVKHPETTPALPFLFKQFPDAKVIYIVRDPKGWLTSQKFFPSHLQSRDISSVFSACILWLQQVDTA